MMFVGLQRENPNDLPSQMIGRPAPTLTTTPLAGHAMLTQDDLQKSEVKIVNFWASWCAPCRVEHPNIQALADMGIAIYGINYKDKAEQANQFLNSLGNPYAKIGADAGRTGLDWGLYGVPETFVIGPDGRVLYRHAGPVTTRVMNDTILPLLAN
ncbi:thiol:disulfide interchange protein [Amylibacter marinus]|uniref:Thiol:disulfide interchange protein n=2 Tax=Amylibacter marinus TaxID=1475483 RepID=A0ABQ5VU80_9RHOB|nr:thiol:disulfide interchange protein [Amylibacter marinus]